MAALFGSFLALADARNAFGAIGVSAVLIWPHARSFRSAITIQCVGSAGLSTYFGLGGSTTAAASCAIGMAQLVAASMVLDRAKLYAIYLGSLMLLGLCIAQNWEGWPSALVGSGALLSTYARVQSSALRMKQWFLIASPFWLIHNIITANYFALVVDAFSVTSSGWSVLEEDETASLFVWPKSEDAEAYA